MYKIYGKMAETKKSVWNKEKMGQISHSETASS